MNRTETKIVKTLLNFNRKFLTSSKREPSSSFFNYILNFSFVVLTKDTVSKIIYITQNYIETLIMYEKILCGDDLLYRYKQAKIWFTMEYAFDYNNKHPGCSYQETKQRLREEISFLN